MPPMPETVLPMAPPVATLVYVKPVQADGKVSTTLTGLALDGPAFEAVMV